MTKKKLKVLNKQLDLIEGYSRSAVEMLHLMLELELAKNPQKGELHIKLSPAKK